MRRRGRKSRPPTSVVLALTAAVVLAGCTVALNSRQGPRFVTSPPVSDTAMLWARDLRLVDVAPGSRIHLRAWLDTELGRWTSSAGYSVPGSGVLDLDTARPQLAAFREPDSTGLFWSLRGPDVASSELVQLWTRSTVAVTLEASEKGRIIASREFPLGGYGAGAAPITVSTFDLAQSAVAAGETFLPPS